MMKKMSFVSSFFKSMKNLYKEDKQMKEESCSETSRRFQEEEGPCTSYDQRRKPLLQRAPKHFNMPFSFEEDKKQGNIGHLDQKILSDYLVEYKSQRRAFKKTLAFPQFIHLKEEMRPYGKGGIKGNRLLLYTFDGSYTAKDWARKLDAFFLLHPVVEREAVEIATLHLEGENTVTDEIGNLTSKREL